MSSACPLPLTLGSVTSAAANDAARGVGGRPLGRADAERLAGFLKVVSDATRLQLLSMIADAEGGEACVSDLVEPLGLRQPTVSHHLKVLVDAGLLTRERRGNWVWFSVVPDQLDTVARILR